MNIRTLRWFLTLVSLLTLLSGLAWSQKTRPTFPKITGPFLTEVRPRGIAPGIQGLRPDLRRTYVLNLNGFRSKGQRRTILVYRVPVSKASLFSKAKSLRLSRVARYRSLRVSPDRKEPIYVEAAPGESIYVGVLDGDRIDKIAPAQKPYPPTAGNDPIVWLTPSLNSSNVYDYTPSFTSSSVDNQYDYFLIAQPYNNFSLDTSQVTTPGVIKGGVAPMTVQVSGLSYLLSGTIEFNGNSPGNLYVVWVGRKLKSNPTSTLYQQFDGASGGQAVSIAPQAAP